MDRASTCCKYLQVSLVGIAFILAGSIGATAGFVASGDHEQRINQLEELPAMLGAQFGLTIFLHVPYAQRITVILPWVECHARPSRIFMFVKPQHLGICQKQCSTKPNGRLIMRCACGLHSLTRVPLINQKRNLSSFFMHHALEYLKLRSTALLFAHADFYLDIAKFVGDGSAITVAEPENVTAAMGVGTSRFRPVPGTNGTRDMIHHRGLGCISLESLDEAEHEWHRGYRRHCRTAAGAIGSAVCCVAWMDAFYLPAQPAREFIRALPFVHNLPNEAALPTLLNHVAQTHAGGLTRAVRCPGGCCNAVPWRDALEKGCGHRVNLALAPPSRELSCDARRRRSGDVRRASSLLRRNV